jgi:hypothetical protein
MHPKNATYGPLQTEKTKVFAGKPKSEEIQGLLVKIA